MRPGFQTTEFWLSAVAQVLSLGVLLGVLTANESKALEEALGKCVAAVCTILVNAQVVIHYIKSRTTLKTNGNGNDSGHASGPTPTPAESTGAGPKLLGGLLATVLVGGVGALQAAPVLPWRAQIDHRLFAQEQLLRDLFQQRPTPAPPVPSAPPIIVLPQPYQTLPIAGDPRQGLPIPGPPQQVLPPQGEPRQELPTPGPPRQPLPVQPAPPTGQSPQRYSIRALWRAQ